MGYHYTHKYKEYQAIIWRFPTRISVRSLIGHQVAVHAFGAAAAYWDAQAKVVFVCTRSVYRSELSKQAAYREILGST